MASAKIKVFLEMSKFSINDFLKEICFVKENNGSFQIYSGTSVLKNVISKI
jgi:hypothetical protein